MSHVPDSSAGRRRFLKLVGFAGISSTLVPRAVSWAQGGAGATPPKPELKPQPVSPPPADEKPPEIAEDAKTLAAVVAKRYSLTDEQRDLIAKDFDGDLQAGKRLRGVKLANGDEPDFTFKA